jgi:hypothetical protein
MPIMPTERAYEEPSFVGKFAEENININSTASPLPFSLSQTRPDQESLF